MVIIVFYCAIHIKQRNTFNETIVKANTIVKCEQALTVAVLKLNQNLPNGQHECESMMKQNKLSDDNNV